MTMIDEEELVRLLQGLGDSFEISNEVQGAILEAARPEPRAPEEVDADSIDSPFDPQGQGFSCRSSATTALGRWDHIRRRLTEQFRQSAHGGTDQIGAKERRSVTTIGALGVKWDRWWI